MPATWSLSNPQEDWTVNGPSGDSRCRSDAASLPVTRQVRAMMASRVSCSGRLELSSLRISRMPSATTRRLSASSCLALSSWNRLAFSTARPIWRPTAMSRVHSSARSDLGVRVLMTMAPEHPPLGRHRHADHQRQAFLADPLLQLALGILGQRPRQRVLRVELLAGERGAQRQPRGEADELGRQSPVGHEHQLLALLVQPVRRPRFHPGGFHGLVQGGLADFQQVQRSAHHGGHVVQRRQHARALVHAPLQVQVGLLQLGLRALSPADVHVGADDAQHVALRVALHHLAARGYPEPPAVPGAQPELHG